MCRQVVVDRENGLLCKVKDAADLADKMEQMMLQKQESLEKMGKAGRQRMEQLFDEKIIIEKYHKQIEAIRKI